ncbi:MAG: hypothetical protein IJQ02_11695 [Oscillospiraceae bacterium]|nr:hypothetical protein [Oscillospiraceae bacterium]
MNEKAAEPSVDRNMSFTEMGETSSTSELIEQVKAEIARKPTPFLIVLLRALEKMEEEERKEADG